MIQRVILFLLLSFFLAPISFAIECDGVPPSGAGKEAEINQYIEKCTEKINGLKKEQTSLKQAIDTINSKINLAQGQINQTQVQIINIEKEIGVLGGVLDKVNESMSDLTKIYLARVKESYKRIRVDSMGFLFSSNSFSDYFTKLKYLNTVKSKDQLILTELEKSRIDYDARRQSKLEKQQEIEKLKKRMEDQKKVLGSQQLEKKNLLAATASDEKKYQKLLSDAKAQLAALRRFVSSNGGASILSNQTKCDDWGCYYNQRDSQWGNMGLGGSNYSVAEYGCLISSVSMMASHAGKNIKPSDIAANASAFVSGYGYLLHSFSVNGINVTVTNISKDKLDDELKAGRSVIAGLFGGPDHFIVIVKKDGDKYIMHDPFLENGSNRPLTDKYSVSNINSLRLVSFN
jgi:peptidoglycan hydrolase CwlO-like protein